MMFSCEVFTRKEFELAFHGMLKSGDEKGIASRVGADQSTISKFFNPNALTGTVLYRAACIFAAWVSHSPGRGRLALRTFNNFVERAMPKHDASPEAKILRLVESVKVDVAEIAETAAAVREEMPLIRIQMREEVAAYMAKKGDKAA